MQTFADWSSAFPILALAIPITLMSVAIASPNHAERVTKAALAMALTFTVGAIFARETPHRLGATVGVQVDAATCVMLLLVCTLGAIVVRYSRRYLHGDPGLATHQRWLLLTLTAVTALVSARSLLVVALSWTVTSLALHQLLTFYSNRPAALVAAHKKFLVSRLADVSLVVSLALLHANVGSFEIDRVATFVESRADLPPSMEVAAGLLVVSVALRSAQLPFHGWLIQVMEAPTPVSALLHAGVVNIGGFVLIRLAPWLVRAEIARVLLVAIGLISAVAAALIMTTRVSVKVALAWSTCAQMGFMLVECGLGLWSLALLHLVAHSLYKAHAFLRAGSAVEVWEVHSTRDQPASPSLRRLGFGALLSLGCVLLGRTALHVVAPMSSEAEAWFLALFMGLAIVPLWVAIPRGAGSRITAVAAARAVGVVLSYVAWHAVVGWMMPSDGATSSRWVWLLVILGFGGLFLVKAVLQLQPDGRLARALHPWLFYGLYLDEGFTRLTFRIWPARLRPSRPRSRPLGIRHTSGVRA